MGTLTQRRIRELATLVGIRPASHNINAEERSTNWGIDEVIEEIIVRLNRLERLQSTDPL